MPCFSHCLNLGVEKVCLILEISKLIAHCRHFVVHINHSSKDTYVLKLRRSRRIFTKAAKSSSKTSVPGGILHIT